MNRCKAFIFLFPLLFLAACVSPRKDDFDRKELLKNLFQSIIIPDFTAFQSSAENLKTTADAFALSPSASSLDSLKSAFLAAYVKVQAVEAYDFTPSQNLRNNLNSFPPDTAQIIANIIAGSYDLNAANNIRAKGFPGLEFILFSKSESDVIAEFISSTNAVNRKQYLTDLTTEIQTVAQSSLSNWMAYETSFVSASGTDVGSSVAMLVNDLSFASERCRRDRVGNALGYVGVVSGGNKSPYSLEAFYSNYSKELLYENLTRLQAIYEGTGAKGFDDYLTYLNADYNGVPLATAITNQFNLARIAANNLPDNFATALTTHPAEMESLFLELKKLTVLLKVDMSSQIGVIINYSDNDGD